MKYKDEKKLALTKVRDLYRLYGIQKLAVQKKLSEKLPAGSVVWCRIGKATVRVRIEEWCWCEVGRFRGINTETGKRRDPWVSDIVEVADLGGE